MRAIVILGPWGSGTTAVAGLLARLGVDVFGPTFATNDKRTPDSYELVAFRRIISNHLETARLRFRGDGHRQRLVKDLLAFKQELVDEVHGKWSRPERIALLKMPLASLCTRELAQAFDVRFVLVLRSLKDIETSRVRRKWPEVAGVADAARIYSQVLEDLLKTDRSFLAVNYAGLLNNTSDVADDIIKHCGLEHLRANMPEALSFIRRSPSAG